LKIIYNLLTLFDKFVKLFFGNLHSQIQKGLVINQIPEKVGHLHEMAQLMEFPMKEAALNFLGDSPDGFRKTIQWDWGWMEDASGPSVFKDLGIYGMNISKYDNTFCTGCSVYMNPLLVMLASMWKKGKKSTGFEFLTGKAYSWREAIASIFSPTTSTSDKSIGLPKS